MSRRPVMTRRRVMGADTRGCLMPPERSLDIDTELDFRLAELLLKLREDTR